MKKQFIFLLTLITINALKVSMLFYCDDACDTIKLDNKIIYNNGYESALKGYGYDYFFFPEFEAEPGQKIKIKVRDINPYHLKLCGEINIDGYIFNTNYSYYYWLTDERRASSFSELYKDGYYFNCIGFDRQNTQYSNYIWFGFKIPLNLENSDTHGYRKQYNCENLDFYLQKGKSVEFDLSHFIGNRTIKLVHPISFEFSSLKGNLKYIENGSNVISRGNYPKYKFNYTASDIVESYYETVKYYVYKYNETIDSNYATITFYVDEQYNNDYLNTECQENKYYVLKGNKKICYNSCPYSHTNEIENTKECVKFCKDPYFYLDGRYTYTTCVKSCKEHTKFFDPYSRKCLDKCPEDYFEKYNYKTRECMAECEENLKYRLDEESNACLDDCSPNDTLHYTDVSNKCKKSCTFIDVKVNKCINSCNTFYYIDDKNNKLCTEKCDENHYYIDVTDGKKCIENCVDFITEEKKCVKNCGTNIYYYESENKKYCTTNCYNSFQFIGEDGKKCVNSCPNYISQDLKKCVSNCGEKYYYEIDGIKYCIDECKNDFPFIDEEGKKCVDNCPNYINKELTNCVNDCRVNEYYNIIDNKKYCVEKCENPFPFIDEDGKKCVNNCEHYINKELTNCVNDCEVDEFYNVIDGKKHCVEECDNSQFIDEDGKTCVNDCINFKNMITRKCVHEMNDCIGMFIIEENKECVEKCENGPYIYINNEKNYCESVDSCINRNYKIYKGECIKNCPKYYINDNGYCKLDCIDIDDNTIDCKRNKTILIDLIYNYLNELLDNKNNIKGENVDIKIIKNNENLEENSNYKKCLNNLNITDYIILKINSSNKIEFKPLYLNGKEIDISECKNEEIDIYVNNNDNDLWKKINEEYNYDIYDSNDEFYNDYCSIYNERNLDVIIKDRRKIFYKNFCSKSNCEYSNFNPELKKVNCKCNNSLNSFFIDENIDNNNNNSFSDDYLINTNIAVITCWKNLKNLNIKNNIGFLPITTLITVKIILFIYLKLFIKKNLNNKCINIFSNPPKKLVIKNKYTEDSKKNSQQVSTSNTGRSTTNILKYRIKQEKPKYQKIKMQNINIISFRHAYKIDKRNFCHIFFSILSYKCDIIRIFVKNNPFDFFSIKIISYLTRIAILYVFNIILFFDKHISKLYDKGKYKIITLDNIKISLIGWIIFEIISKLFRIYLNNTYNISFELIKEYEPYEKDEKLLEKNKNYINKRLTIFSIIEFFLLFFCLYYSTVYGTVFKNSQKYCLFNTLIGIVYNIIFGIIFSIILNIIRKIAIIIENSRLYNIFICLWNFY